MNSLQYFKFEWRVWLALYRVQVNIKFLTTDTVINKELYNWWPLYIIKNISRANVKITYFRRNMLFDSGI